MVLLDAPLLRQLHYTALDFLKVLIVTAVNASDLQLLDFRVADKWARFKIIVSLGPKRDI